MKANFNAQLKAIKVDKTGVTLTLSIPSVGSVAIEDLSRYTGEDEGLLNVTMASEQAELCDAQEG